MMNRFTYFVLTLGVAFTLSCERRELESMEEQDCALVPCTEELRWVTVKVTDRSGQPVALDKVKVIRQSDGKDLTRTYPREEWQVFRKLGSYAITGDLDEKHIPQFKRTKLRFQGYVGNREVVKADYVVTFDCCHISLVSGELELTVR